MRCCLFVISVVVGLSLLTGCATAPDRGQAATAADPSEAAALRDATEHTRAGRYAQATAIYEQALQRNPKNADAVAGCANLFHEQGRREPDPAKQRKLLLRSRKLAQQAEKLGTNNPLTPLILQAISADGRIVEIEKGVFSSSEKVDALMRQGEAAFGRRDLDAALALYQQAYELQPTNYAATLYIGDVYFSRQQFAEAREWFGRAVALDPDRETGHRYLGDALIHLGAGPAALNEWIEALLCEPYLRVTRQHFTDTMRAEAEKAGYVVPRFPAANSEFEDGNLKLHLSPDDGMLIMSYHLGAIAWREAEFAKTFPTETKRRRSLAEEVAAIDGMLTVAEEAAGDPEAAEDLRKWQAVVTSLRQLKSDGLLEACILLDRPDEGIAKDYAAYREHHRDALRQYVRRYWCGLRDAPR